MTTSVSLPPPGFSVHARTSPATVAWEPILAASNTGVFRLGLFVSTAHCNSRGILHGGVIATLADNACGLTYAMALGAAAKGIVTTSLAVDYVGIAELGQWLEVTPRVVKIGNASGVIDALVTGNGAIVARANASFRLLR